MLGLPRPTAQQVAIIESPLAPALVIAGAGSGKTETMASRVLWLLATGQVRPGEILGLTFTRKAAGELSARIRERIGQLSDHGLLPGDYDDFDPPVVATYNSFANTIYRDNALLIGRESDGAVLGEASAWQLARTLVVRSSDPALPTLDKSVDTVTKAVLSLSHALSENVADAASVRTMAHTFAALGDLPSGGKGDYAQVVELARTVGALPVLLDLAEQFAREKMRRGFVEYSDQVALALQIVRSVPKVVDDHRDRFKVVLLDEYQDTSVVQTWLLAELFRGHPVMAVGDPNQSIYGWRGASAANLEQFASQFARRRGARLFPVDQLAQRARHSRGGQRPGGAARRAQQGAGGTTRRVTDRIQRAGRGGVRGDPGRGGRRGGAVAEEPAGGPRTARETAHRGHAVPRPQDPGRVHRGAAHARGAVPRPRRRRAHGRAGDRGPGVRAHRDPRPECRLGTGAIAVRVPLAHRRAGPARAQPSRQHAAGPRLRAAGAGRPR